MPDSPGSNVPESDYKAGGYANGFDSDFISSGHAALWGRQAAQTEKTIQGWVSQYKPDYLLIMLGFNDLGWFVSGPDGLMNSMGNIVGQARSANPKIKILIGNVVDRTFIGGRQDLVDNTIRYNQMLRNHYPNWWRWESPISLVNVNSAYQCRTGGCPDGYDGLHPNALGEYHIAQAYAKVLKSDFGFAGQDFQVPGNIPARVVSTPTNVRSSTVGEGILTTWDVVPNARGYEIRTRLQGMSDWWSEGSVYPSTNAHFIIWLLEGQTWEVQVRAVGDNSDRSAWSGLTSATAKPSTSPGPKNIKSQPTGDGVQVSWDAVTGYNVNRYGVIVWDLDTEGAWIDTRDASGTSLFVGGLIPGHRYGVWVATYVNMRSSITGDAIAAQGLPREGRHVIIGGGNPQAVSNLVVTNTDPTTVQLSWTPSAGAAGYAIYVRNKQENKAAHLDSTVTEPNGGVGFLFPGTWFHEFCIKAYNGDSESGQVCITPPVYPGFETRRRSLHAKAVPAQDGALSWNSSSSVDFATLGKLHDLFVLNRTAIPDAGMTFDLLG